MGELEDYYVIRRVAIYDEDPLKIGRVKCNIPGVVNKETSRIEAIPWCRPYRMHGYQTFSRPLVDELVWVLISKTNYNEFWWTYFHETIDITQEFLNEYYDHQPDVFHARNCSKVVMNTFDDIRGYYTKVGDDYMNLGMNREMKISYGDCKIMIEGNHVYAGSGDDHGGYEPTIKGIKCQDMQNKLIAACDKLLVACKTNGVLAALEPGFLDMNNALHDNILCDNTYVN